MAELKRKLRWVRWEPSLGGNLEAKPDERFFFEVAVGWTWDELNALWESLTRAGQKVLEAEVMHLDSKATALAEAEKAFALAVRLGDEPLTLDGKPVASLADYVDAASKVAGMPDVFELLTAVRRLNSVSGAREVFSERPSGGHAGTAPLSVVPAIPQPAAPPSGEVTSASASSASP